MTRKWLPKLVSAAAVAATVALYLIANPADEEPPLERGVNVLAASYRPDERGDEKLASHLSQLRWKDIQATIEEGVRNSSVRDRLVAAASGPQVDGPLLYAAALATLADGDAASSLHFFRRIDARSIPATLLYAPFRLQLELAPSSVNLFEPLLAAAVQHRDVPPLTAARYLGMCGHVNDALDAYLQSDPANWGDVELSVFRPMLTHAGAGRETRSMLAAALRGGRVESDLSAVIRQMVVEIDYASETSERLRLTARIKSDEAFRKHVVRGASKQLEIRRAFMERRYDELVQTSRESSVLEQTSETVMLLSLAAARIGDNGEFSRWTNELKRRIPSDETQAWINELSAAIQ